MAEEVVAAKLSVPVESDTNGFREKLKAKLEKASKGLKAVIEAEIDTDHLREELTAAVKAAEKGLKARIGVEVDSDGLRERLVAAVKAAQAGVNARVGVDLDTNTLRQQLTGAVEAAEAGQNATVGVEWDTNTLRERLIAAVKAAETGVNARVGVIYDNVNVPGGRGSGEEGAAGSGPGWFQRWFARMRARRGGEDGDGAGRGPWYRRWASLGRGGAPAGNESWIMPHGNTNAGPGTSFNDWWRGRPWHKGRAARRVLGRGGMMLGGVAGIGTLLAGAVGGLTGAVPLLGVLGPMVQTLSVLPLTLTGLGATIGAVMLAFAGFTGDVNDLTGSMRKARIEVDGLSDDWGRLQSTVQENFWAPMVGHIEQNVGRMLGVLRSAYGPFVQELGEMGKSLLDWVGSDEFASETAIIGEHTRRFAEDLRAMLFGIGGVSKGLIGWLGDIMVATGPLQDRIGNLLREFGVWAGLALDEQHEVEAFQAKMNKALDYTLQVGRIIRETFGGIAGIFRGGEGPMRSLLDALEGTVTRWHDWVDSDAGQARILEFFENLEPLAREVGRLLGDVVKEILSIVENPELVNIVREMRTDLLPALSGFIEGLIANVGPGLVDLVTNLLESFSLLTDDGELIKPVLEAINSFLEGVNDFLAANPGAAQTIGGIITALLALRALAPLTGPGGVFDMLGGLFGGLAGGIGGALGKNGGKGGVSGFFRGMFGLGGMKVHFGGIPQPVFITGGLPGAAGTSKPQGAAGRGGTGGTARNPYAAPGGGTAKKPGVLGRLFGGAKGGLIGGAGALLGGILLGSAAGPAGNWATNRSGSTQTGGFTGGALNGAAWGWMFGLPGILTGSLIGGKIGQYGAADSKGKQKAASWDRGGLNISRLLTGMGLGGAGAGIGLGLGTAGGLLSDAFPGLSGPLDAVRRFLDPRGAAASTKGKNAVDKKGAGGWLDALPDTVRGAVDRALGHLDKFTKDAPGKVRLNLAPAALSTMNSLIAKLPPGVQQSLLELGVFKRDANGKVHVDLGGTARLVGQSLYGALPAPVSQALETLGIFKRDANGQVRVDLSPEAVATANSLANSLPPGVQQALVELGIFKRDASGQVSVDLAGVGRLSAESLRRDLPPEVYAALEQLGIFKTEAPSKARVDLSKEGSDAGNTLKNAIPAPIRAALEALGVFKSEAPGKTRVDLSREGSGAGLTLKNAIPAPIRAALEALGVFKSGAPGKTDVNLAPQGSRAGNTLRNAIPGPIGMALSALGVFRSRAPGQTNVDLSSKGRHATSTLRSPIPGGISGALSALGVFRSRAPGSVNVSLWSAGRTVVSSLISGLQSRMGAVISAARTLGNLIKENKGPIEYDRVMLIPEGQAIVDGLVRGLESRYGRVRSSLRGLSADIAGTDFTATAGFDNLPRNSTNGLRSAPRPVLMEFHDGAVRIYNPTAEPASRSLTAELRNLSEFGLED